jgi:hypothetical protein
MSRHRVAQRVPQHGRNVQRGRMYAGATTVVRPAGSEIRSPQRP